MGDQRELSLFETFTDATSLLTQKEDQWFERKSVRTEPKHLADLMVAFANADVGRILVGAHDGKCEGFTRSGGDLNAIQQAPADFIAPPLKIATRLVPCPGPNGEPWDVLLIDVPASSRVHRNARGTCFVRVGDERRTLSAEDEREPMGDKGETNFDLSPVPHVLPSDLREDLVEAYRARIGASEGSSLRGIGV